MLLTDQVVGGVVLAYYHFRTQPYLHSVLSQVINHVTLKKQIREALSCGDF